MTRFRKLAGITAVEATIVAVIAALLAATVVPHFCDPANDAITSGAKFQLHTLRSQIELYKSQHAGKLPSPQLTELVRATNRAGKVGTGPNFPYGPYLANIPENPVTGSHAVAAAPAGGAVPNAVVPHAGWQYDAGTGSIWFNDNTYYPFWQQ